MLSYLWIGECHACCHLPHLIMLMTSRCEELYCLTSSCSWPADVRSCTASPDHAHDQQMWGAALPHLIMLITSRCEELHCLTVHGCRLIILRERDAPSLIPSGEGSSLFNLHTACTTRCSQLKTSVMSSKSCNPVIVFQITPNKHQLSLVHSTKRIVLK
jgi:hypothetical protein